MSHSRLDFQRLVVGYHGCDRALAEKVLLDDEPLKPSRNPWDWLGEGIYFWEHGPQRALEFAFEQKARGKVKTPFVLGAYIQIGRCLDLTDTRSTQQVGRFFPVWKAHWESIGLELPQNKTAGLGDHDLLLRYRDCAVLNDLLKSSDEEFFGLGTDQVYHQTVRGVFQEGDPVFPGSRIFSKTHIQVSVRDPTYIIGFFKPAISES